jgi:geranylgeranyl diphosphate synthase type II
MSGAAQRLMSRPALATLNAPLHGTSAVRSDLPKHIDDDAASRKESVERLLETYSALVRKCILEVISTADLGPDLYAPLTAYPVRGGKGLRPALCIATCRAFGGRLGRVLNSAVALELLHNAFLVHDDIEDGSEYRRGKPTLHTEYGTALAINVGDAMNALSLRLLIENRSLLGAELSWRICAEFEHLAGQSVEGQAMELGWIRDNRCDLADTDYLRMILKKTCWYSAMHPCRVGALIASSGACAPEDFDLFGYYLGAAFQIQDDILNLVGDQDTYGKEIGGDIYEGKRTLILIHLLNSCSPDEKEQIKLFLAESRTTRSASDVARIMSLIIQYRSIEYARSCARDLAAAALHQFQIAYRRASDNNDTRFIEGLVHYLMDRKS